jgi:alpha-methylacyl-CoA racemase
MAVGALEPQFYAEFTRLLFDGSPEADLPGQWEMNRWPEMRERFAERFRSRTREEWAKVFDGSDACVAPVLSLAEAPNHPHLAERGTFVTHGGVVQPAPAPRFSRTPARLDQVPARPGEHTREALTAWGFDDVAELLAAGAVIQT